MIDIEDKAAVRDWLTEHYDPHPSGVEQGTINCIMSQDDWQFLDLRMEMFLNSRFGDEDPEVAKQQAQDYALSALYECHDGPHIKSCSYFYKEA